ncbi:hypothetical protein Fmac_025252 [Flemingia macrophylla]|uniref:Uncharacterized protein n=1 Tax=Flemingia macrophylla TaxID=520843 RepID=A0ABD1LRQ9_9FABA
MEPEEGYALHEWRRFTRGETSNALSLGEGIIVGHMNSNIKEDESLVAWDWA